MYDEYLNQDRILIHDDKVNNIYPQLTWAEHWEERFVNPTISANKILKQIIFYILHGELDTDMFCPTSDTDH